MKLLTFFSNFTNSILNTFDKPTLTVVTLDPKTKQIKYLDNFDYIFDITVVYFTPVKLDAMLFRNVNHINQILNVDIKEQKNMTVIDINDNWTVEEIEKDINVQYTEPFGQV